MNESSGGFAKVVAIVIVAVLVIGAVVYFTSDVYRTKMDSAMNQYARWTPENIAKDPINYLNFCESEANKALLQLKASEIAIAQKRGELDAMSKEAANKIKVGERALTELKSAYSTAASAKTWPVVWQGQNRDEDWTKRQIVSFHRQVEAQKTLNQKIGSGIRTLDVQVTKVQEARAETEQQLTEIKTGRELLKVQQITDDLTKRFASIKAVLQTTVAVAGESTATVTLDQLAAQQVTTVDDSEFNAIMAK